MRQKPQSTPPAAPLHLLVAEDGAVNRTLALALLQREGFLVTLVHNGEQAVGRLRDNGHFDVVLMDVEMPVMDGLAATRAIRAWDRQTGVHTPIVALTSNANRQQCIAAGMDAFLSKPLQIPALREVLATVLSADAA